MAPEVSRALVFGIGNPGPRYALTRHNLGFMVVDRLALRAGAAFEPLETHLADGARCGLGGADGHLIKPLSYVNRCGPVLESLRLEGEWSLDRILVVVDDLALPPGRLRLRGSGSHGGHNGLRSLIEHLGTQEFPRLRIGVGESPDGPAEEFVLRTLAPDELPLFDRALNRACAAVETWAREGLEAAMAAFNGADLDDPAGEP